MARAVQRVRGLMSDREYLTEQLEDEERAAGSRYVHPAVRSYMYSPMGADSDSPDEDTVKGVAWTEEAHSAIAHQRTHPHRSSSASSSSTTTSDEDTDGAGYGPRTADGAYRTLTPSRALDVSTRRDDDFRWMPQAEAGNGEAAVDGRTEWAQDDFSNASLDRKRRSAGDRADRDRKSKSSLSGKPPQHPTSARPSPRPRRLRDDDPSPELQRRWNSYEHFRWPEGGWWPMCWCHPPMPPPPPPCCMHERTWPSHPSLHAMSTRQLCKNDAEERVRRLEADKESLQLQVQVLSEQIAAQTEKMADLERALHDARQRIDDAEQRLQKYYRMTRPNCGGLCSPRLALSRNDTNLRDRAERTATNARLIICICRPCLAADADLTEIRDIAFISTCGFTPRWKCERTTLKTIYFWSSLRAPRDASDPDAFSHKHSNVYVAKSGLKAGWGRELRTGREQYLIRTDSRAGQKQKTEPGSKTDVRSGLQSNEMLVRSSLETQKLELLSKLSEVRLRAVERGVLERSPPPEPAPASAPLARPPPPRTPPANYGRQIERNTHMYSSLPRSAPDARLAFGKHTAHNMVVARDRGHSVPNLAEKDDTARGSPSPSLREVRARLGSGGGGGGARLEGGDLTRGGYRATAAPRLQRDHPYQPWQTIDAKQWDTDTTCGWLESLGLEVYCSAARAWLSASPDARGLIATATPGAIEKELAIKHPMHRKKIVLALLDLQGGHGDPLLTASGRLDTAWALRWMEDVGVSGARDAAAEAALDGRLLHRLTHNELHTHLHVHQALHALSIRRGIQVLRDNEFSPDTMIRRAAEGEGGGDDTTPGELARWSSHRVMQWLKEIDLAEYAPNLRGAGVHGGLMLLEPRFTAELLAALLNIPAHKTLLRRHLTQRFNDLLGRDVIQQKRNAEQTLGYQPLTTTTKYKIPKKSQFSLKRKKSKDETDYGELVCPLNDDCSGDITATPTMKLKSAAGVASAVSPQRDEDEKAH
ncbi:Liprin-beta-2 [Eumeta japonica]|uniref:Liprin-beta-2 n=1 Tax=Eumeta variegata TaxID=151549 RepID=A0A4C1WZG4_EUMVA|nr:Liprin-beta-2 [Eumeta japonica]